MVASLNLHDLFSPENGYLAELAVSGPDRETLRKAREDIRATIRRAFVDWQKYVRETELVEKSMMHGVVPFHVPVPRFKLQGSFAYGTVNDCQQHPQQIDQDDGLFLPVTFITNNGNTHPAIASKAYFKIVEGALAPLCRQRGWRLNPDGPKDNCVRVEVSDRLHIDIPLYAIRDDAFARLTETAVDMLHKSMAFAQDSADLTDEVYTGLAEAEIVLADRKLGWILSDPRKLEKWFEAAVRIFGEQARRLSRILKGMRDYRWKKCDLGSLCIMAALVKALERVGRLDNRRDDLALLAIGRELDRVLVHPIDNPAFPGQVDKYLCNEWSPEFRREVRSVIADMCDNLDRAVNRMLDKDRALQIVRQTFGDRVPVNRDLIFHVGAASTIRQTPPAPQPRPVVPRTKSG